MATAMKRGAGMAEVGASVGGIGSGVGSTLLVRRQFDKTGETTVLRPSVLWGVLTGAAALTLPMAVGRRHGPLWEALEDYGEAAFAAGLVSAFSPKGGGVQVPTI